MEIFNYFIKAIQNRFLFIKLFPLFKILFIFIFIYYFKFSTITIELISITTELIAFSIYQKKKVLLVKLYLLFCNIMFIFYHIFRIQY